MKFYATEPCFTATSSKIATTVVLGCHIRTNSYLIRKSQACFNFNNHSYYAESNFSLKLFHICVFSPLGMYKNIVWEGTKLLGASIFKSYLVFLFIPSNTLVYTDNKNHHHPLSLSLSLSLSMCRLQMLTSVETLCNS